MVVGPSVFVSWVKIWVKIGEGGVLSLSIVLAVVSQSVVNGAIVVDESSSREPIPQVLCILAILLLVRSAIRQMRGDRQEEFVRDSVNIDISYIGVNAGVSAGGFLGRILTGSARAFLSILEVTYQMLINPNRNIQILLLLHKIIRRNPRKRPPPIIII